MDSPIREELWGSSLSNDASEQEAAQSLAALVTHFYGLKPFPSSAQKLLMLSHNEDYDVGELAAIVEEDPTLAARVLRLVNSAAYSLRMRCVSISHAVTLLGAKAISELGSALIVLDMFNDKSGPAAAIRDHVLSVAVLSRHVARLGSLPTDDIFTCGLLHDIGKLMMLQVSETDYSLLLYQAGNHSGSIHLQEQKTYGYDHAVLAGHMLYIWQIPPPIPLVVAWHHKLADIIKKDKAIALMIGIILFADQLFYLLNGQEKPEKEMVEKLINDEPGKVLGITEKMVESEWTTFREVLSSSKII